MTDSADHRQGVLATSCHLDRELTGVPGFWYTTPTIEGESLRAALERKRIFAVREVVRIVYDVVDARAFAHERGVVHRDITPANILMQGAHALVTDFGVAKPLSAALPMSGLTSAGIATPRVRRRR
jgi:serine/threonine-protein kinase